MKHRLGMSAIVSHPEAPSVCEQIKLYADVGFDSFFLSSGVTDEYHRIPEWAGIAHRAGIVFEAVHAPTDGVNALWSPNGDGNAEAAAQAYMARAGHLLELMSKGEVDKLVLHVSHGTPPNVNDIGLSRFSALESLATERGVHLCYENATGARHIEEVVKHCSPGHGFCHDVGHNSCYTPGTDFIALCGDRLVFTHIHDNRGAGNGDLHLLPFDGTTDWSRYASSLASVGYTGTLNLELACIHSKEYRSWSFARFTEEAYVRLCRLDDMIDAQAAQLTAQLAVRLPK